ncbi:DUF3916 domain-containing protein [Metabacillus litoralis]|uniref:DUF3916 domain-containing protein n=1 Tax=Metabacillus litoralis TaxID=152268 RepID=UPI001CFD0A87|nr:DUF3916 domain-containing protein [Metabacillus litoralis]
MREKKVRGIKRKANKMIQRIEENTMEFPRIDDDGYRNILLPVSQGFINSDKTPSKIKRLCLQTMVNRAKHLVEMKPTDKEKYRVVVLISLPDLFRSQLIVFRGDSYYQHFFERNNDDQKWSPLSKKRNMAKEWQLSVPETMDILGFKEVITYEEGYHEEGEIWFIGDVN